MGDVAVGAPVARQTFIEILHTSSFSVEDLHDEIVTLAVHKPNATIFTIKTLHISALPQLVAPRRPQLLPHITMEFSRSRPLAGEFLGTAFLLMAVVGSGIMAQRLLDNEGLVLLANAIATGGALIALIITFAGISGAHFNPAVTLSAALQRTMPWTTAAMYMVAQLFGAVAGVALAHAMFGLPTFTPSGHERAGLHILLGEAVATFGLIGVVMACASSPTPSPTPSPTLSQTTIRASMATHAPYAVAGYIVAGYWFTSSTSFANPAVTIARALTDTFTGICYENVPAFVVTQLIAATTATFTFSWLLGKGPKGANE